VRAERCASERSTPLRRGNGIGACPGIAAREREEIEVLPSLANCLLLLKGPVPGTGESVSL
jgi:hypothetical protein